MEPAGQAEIDAGEGRRSLGQAYDPPSRAEPPEDLRRALARNRRARQFFEALDRANRYAITLATADREAPRDPGPPPRDIRADARGREEGAPVSKSVLCTCEDVTLDDVRHAIDKGYRDIESIKRYTGFGTGVCQGKTCL